jgi:cobalt/nickel transport system permease protein
MASLDAALSDLGALEELAAGDTAVHRLDPRAKLLATGLFLILVVSFDRYTVSALVPFALYPWLTAVVGQIPWRHLGRRLLLVSPFGVMLALPNLLLDGTVQAMLGSLPLTGGLLSFASILLRFALTVTAALVLVATTGIAPLCASLGRLGMPRVLVTQLLLLVRYSSVLGAEAARMTRARALRSVGRADGGLRAYGALVGQLLLRAVGRAQRIHRAMSCRGFTGEVRLPAPLRFGPRDAAFLLGSGVALVGLRLVDLPLLLGNAVMRLLG